jgi:hypothetical protein
VDRGTKGAAQSAFMGSKQVLEQQYQSVAARGSRPMLALGVSQGFTYEWNANNPQGSRVVEGLDAAQRSADRPRRDRGSDRSA